MKMFYEKDTDVNLIKDKKIICYTSYSFKKRNRFDDKKFEKIWTCERVKDRSGSNDKGIRDI